MKKQQIKNLIWLMEYQLDPRITAQGQCNIPSCSKTARVSGTCVHCLTGEITKLAPTPAANEQAMNFLAVVSRQHTGEERQHAKQQLLDSLEA